MSVETISALERGARRSPYRETVSLLADALCLSASDRARLEEAAVGRQRVRSLRQHTTEGSLALRPVPEPRDLPESAPSRHNLPSEVSRLIGREDVVAEVGALVAAHRLVTLSGTGGVGKTRIAVRVAEKLLADLPDGVWLVELAALAQPELVISAVAQVLGIGDPRSDARLSSVIGSLRSKRALIVLDNCEHVIDATRDVVAAVLRNCPNMKILSTSRQSLNIAGEWTYRVPSLVYPTESRVTAVEAAAYSAIRLFADRAQAADGTFALTDECAPAVAELCRRLDGIPLAIELAAARVRTFAPRQLVQMLGDRFAILIDGDRAALPRLQTMRAAIDWSFAQLSERERMLARRLGIFVGGWTIEAAERVCADDTLEAKQILDLLVSLVDKSLVTVQFGRNAARYRFLESMRDYALEQLTMSGEREMVVHHHAEWAADYGEWLAEKVFHLSGDWSLAEFGDRVTYEFDNRREALDWALSATGDPLLAVRIAASVVLLTDTDRRDLSERALPRIADSKHRSVQARVIVRLADRGERLLDAARRSVALFEQLGERSHWLATSLYTLENACLLTGRHAEALAANGLELELLHELGAIGTVLHSSALRRRALCLQELRRYEESRQYLSEALALSKTRVERFEVTSDLAELECHMGNVRAAVTVADKAAAAVPRSEWSNLSMSRERVTMSGNRANAAAYQLMLGEVNEARLAALDALEVSSSLISPRQRIWASQHLATVAALAGDPHLAACLRGYIDAWYASEGEVRERTEQQTYDILVRALTERLSKSEIERLATEGALLNDERAVEMSVAAGESAAAR